MFLEAPLLLLSHSHWFLLTSWLSRIEKNISLITLWLLMLKLIEEKTIFFAVNSRPGSVWVCNTIHFADITNRRSSTIHMHRMLSETTRQPLIPESVYRISWQATQNSAEYQRCQEWRQRWFKCEYSLAPFNSENTKKNLSTFLGSDQYVFYRHIHWR